jgi:hypothetical protein
VPQHHFQRKPKLLAEDALTKYVSIFGSIIGTISLLSSMCHDHGSARFPLLSSRFSTLTPSASPISRSVVIDAPNSLPVFLDLVAIPFEDCFGDLCPSPETFPASIVTRADRLRCPVERGVL